MPNEAPDPVDVFTDGACSGNPGPGGWAWAVPAGPQASGSENPSTNQRMEVSAVLDALQTLLAATSRPIRVTSDSTYVVKCFHDRWWKGWLARGWRNSQKQAVANQDLWKPLIELYRTHEDRVTFRWVKGHSGNALNDLVDRLAVAAASSRSPRLLVGTELLLALDPADPRDPVDPADPADPPASHCVPQVRPVAPKGDISGPTIAPRGHSARSPLPGNGAKQPDPSNGAKQPDPGRDQPPHEQRSLF